MSAEQNKSVVRRWLDELFNKGNLSVNDEMLVPNYINHDPNLPEENRNRDGFKQFVSMVRSAFPDLQFNFEEQIAEEDKVVTHFSLSGTNKGEFMGIPPTNKQSRVTGITIEHLEGGKIKETWANWDALGMMQQLGVIPPDK
jgi:steroid delta-isomerase-like uncharacterized protein